MSILPLNTILGKLEIIEEYDFNDFPVLFLCTDDLGHFYIALLIEQGSHFTSWFYLRVSQRRLDALTSGKLDLYEAFRSAEDGSVLEIRVPAIGTESAQINVVGSGELSADNLPYPGEYLA